MVSDFARIVVRGIAVHGIIRRPQLACATTARFSYLTIRALSNENTPSTLGTHGHLPEETEEPDAIEQAFENVKNALDLAFREKKSNDIMFAKQLASSFVEEFTERTAKMSPEQRDAVNKVYLERVDKIRLDLIRLFRLRTSRG